MSDRTLQVVLEKNGRGIRAVYLNDSRIAGRKPWAAEGLPFINVKINEDALKAALKREEAGHE